MLFDARYQDTIIFPVDFVQPTNIPLTLVGVLGTLAWLMVGLRVWTRAWILRSFGWDDATMIVVLIFFTIYNVAFAMGHIIVTGKASVTLREFKEAVIWMLVAEHFYTLGILTLKISLGIFFLRVMVTKWQKRIIYIAMAISTAFGIAYFFFSIFQCGYFSDIFVFLERRVTLRGCVSQQSGLGMGYIAAAVAVITDWVFAILPIFVLRNVHMGDREKYTVFVILSLGAAGSIASVVRFKYVPAVVENTTAFFSHILGLAVWSCVELGIGIIAGSLATLRPLFRKFFGQRGERSKGGSRTAVSSSKETSYARSWRKKYLKSLGTNSTSSTALSSRGGVRKSRIGWPITFGTETTITVGTPTVPMISSKNVKVEWDIEAASIMDAPEKYEHHPFDVLKPLPKIAPRPLRMGGLVELSSLKADKKVDRRFSAPV